MRRRDERARTPGSRAAIAPDAHVASGVRLEVRDGGLAVGARAHLAAGVRLEVHRGRLTVAPGARLGPGTRVHVHGGVVEIGADTVLGDGCVLVAHAGIAIGAGARLGDRVVCLDVEHAHDDPDTPTRLQPLRAAPIRIGADAVIGHGAVLERGADIPDGARVAEHVVVRAVTVTPTGARPTVQT